VADWLSAINAAKARIARLIITIPREGTNAAISKSFVFVPLAIGPGMKVRGFQTYLSSHPAPPSSPLAWIAATNSVQRLQVGDKIAAMMH